MSIQSGLAQTALDNKGLAELKSAARQDKTEQETISQVASQFESLFINMMLKSMRQASLGDGLFDSNQSKMYQDMADQQLSIDIASRGGLGIKEVIMRQLGSRYAEQVDENTVAAPLSTDTVTRRSALLNAIEPSAINTDNASVSLEQGAELEQVEPITEKGFESPDSFVRQLWSMAENAAEKIGVSPAAILSQAALETGWGKHVIKKADNSSSHNLFNIKADQRWQGEATSIGTLEYRDGVAVKEQAQFRVYDSYQASFDDYIQFLQTQPRYREALQVTDNPEAFIEQLHDAGYATDPAYADKIKRIMNSDTLASVNTLSTGAG